MRLSKQTTNLVGPWEIQLANKLIRCGSIRSTRCIELETSLNYIYPLKLFKTFFL